MVDQLWMWRLGDGLILTCFPQRWQQPRNDPYNVLDRIIEDINSKSRDPVQNVDDLALAIVNRCSRAFDDYSSAGGGPSFLNMFDLSLGHVMDKETQLFSRFRRDSLVAASYLRPAQARRQAKSLSVYSDKDARRGLLAAVEPLLNIDPEVELLTELKDLRDELGSLRLLFEAQAQVLTGDSSYWNSLAPSHGFDTAFKDLMMARQPVINEIIRMERQAEQSYLSVTNNLEIKQRSADGIEALFAHKTADDTFRQGHTLMVFTTVTVIFLPLSFIAAFFTINITEFEQAMPLTYVSKFVFGIGLSIAIICVLAALWAEDIVSLFAKVAITIWNFLFFSSHQLYKRTREASSVPDLTDSGNRGSTLVSRTATAQFRARTPKKVRDLEIGEVADGMRRNWGKAVEAYEA